MDAECAAWTPPDGSQDPNRLTFKLWLAIPSHLCPVKGKFHRTGPIHLWDPKGPNPVSDTEESSVLCV